LDGSLSFWSYLRVYLSHFLLRRAFFMLPHQFSSQNLPNRRLWQFIPKFKMGGNFIRGQVLFAESLEFFYG
jgi:hypothetical protein